MVSLVGRCRWTFRSSAASLATLAQFAAGCLASGTILKTICTPNTGNHHFLALQCMGFSQKSNMRRHVRSTHPEVKFLFERFPQSACI
ncbi:putative krueppel-like [Homarus americanus]|uniref:Putative krueppel-like n=1 Tax=Homarus americanus TaxID=6706 RepID=A0A8J5TSW1_HOMAM|nr:putative krueppel-like [Homarus americanus]